MGQDRGSAPAEFVLVGALLIALILGVVQVTLVSHVRHQLTMAAAEGARVASMLDISKAEALSRTTDLVDASFGPGLIKRVSLDYGSREGAPAAVVTVTGSFLSVGYFVDGGEITVSATAPIFVVP